VHAWFKNKLAMPSSETSISAIEWHWHVIAFVPSDTKVKSSHSMIEFFSQLCMDALCTEKNVYLFVCIGKQYH